MLSVVTRARKVQRQLAARFDGEVAGGAILFSGLVFADSGRRWSSGGATDDDIGFAGSGRRRWCRRRSSAARYRVINNDRQILPC
jgi:hypothetical protein